MWGCYLKSGDNARSISAPAFQYRLMLRLGTAEDLLLKGAAQNFKGSSEPVGGRGVRELDRKQNHSRAAYIAYNGCRTKSAGACDQLAAMSRRDVFCSLTRMISAASLAPAENSQCLSHKPHYSARTCLQHLTVCTYPA